MTNFETLHPREGTGRFSEKANSAPDATALQSPRQHANVEHLDSAVGFTYRAENYAVDDILGAVRQSNLRLDLAGVGSNEPREALAQLADTFQLSLSDEYTYDSDAFPKAVFADQLTCSDQDWAGTDAPDHEMLGQLGEHRSCMYCGHEEDGVLTSFAA